MEPRMHYQFFDYYTNLVSKGFGGKGVFTPIRINSKKAPLDKEWNTNPPALEYSPTQLYGMMPPRDILVVDVDVKNGAQGKESWERLLLDNYTEEERKNPGKHPHCPNVETPSGGGHYYISLGDLPCEDIPKNHPNYPGIDFITHGKSQVVGGEQDLDNGHYTLACWFVHPPLKSLDCFRLPEPKKKDPAPSTPPSPQEVIRKAVNLDYSKIKTLLSYIPSDDYELWHKIAWVLMGSSLSEEEAKTLWLEWSSQSPKYNPHDCEKKWEEHKATYGTNPSPLTIASLPYYARQASPEKVGEINALLYSTQDLVGRFCLLQSDTGSTPYRDLHLGKAPTKEIVMMSILSSLVARRSQELDRKAKLLDLINAGDISTPYDEEYAPDQPTPLFISDDGRLLLNTYDPTCVPTQQPYTTPPTGDLAFFINHIHQIFGQYAGDFLDFIAYMTQHPGKKIRYCLVLEGGKGTGKGLIMEAVKNHILGRKNCRVVTTHELTGERNDWVFNVQLVHVDELLITGKDSRKVMERLKTAITENAVPRDAKYMKFAVLPCPTCFIALTNHKDCLKNADSRRYHAVISPIRNPGDIKTDPFSSPREYYGNLARIASQDYPDAGVLRAYFLDYPISSSFNPGERPKVSDFEKIQEISQGSHTEYEDYIDLVKYIYSTDTLPKYINLHLVCRRSTEKSPDHEMPFFEEKLTPKQVKKFGKHMGYSTYSGFLYSNDINVDKAKQYITKYRQENPTEASHKS